MRHDFHNSFGKLFLTTEYTSRHNWIYNNWLGLLATDGVKQGSLGILDLLVRTNCPYMLNDNRLLQGSWKQANDWIEHIWMPQALAAGLRYHAHIVAPGVFGQASAEDLHLRVGDHFQMRLFEEEDEARGWLQEMQRLEIRST